MINNFEQVLKAVKSNPICTVAVAVAQDAHVLEAVIEAKQEGIANAVLVGDENQIADIFRRLGHKTDGFDIIHEMDNTKASKIAVGLVSDKKADMVMKGLVDTATFLRAVLDKECGLRTGKVLSHVAAVEIPKLNKMIFLTDGAMNIAPDLKTKKQIVENALTVARGMGIELPKVAVICAVEVVNLEMPPTVDAALLSKMCDRGQIKNCIIDGPLAIDNALDLDAAICKGIKSDVAGRADILLMPDIEAGNVMYKTLTYASDSKSGGIISGAAAPVILTSRTDSSESKLYSIALASLVANQK